MVTDWYLQICDRHWKKLTRSLPPEMWFVANDQVYKKLFVHADLRAYMGNSYLLQNVIHERGGCPVCFIGEELLSDAIHTTCNYTKTEKEFQKELR